MLQSLSALHLQYVHKHLAVKHQTLSVHDHGRAAYIGLYGQLEGDGHSPLACQRYPLLLGIAQS